LQDSLDSGPWLNGPVSDPFDAVRFGSRVRCWLGLLLVVGGAIGLVFVDGLLRPHDLTVFALLETWLFCNFVSDSDNEAFWVKPNFNQWCCCMGPLLVGLGLILKNFSRSF
jgi:hypothetical protein